MTGKEGARSSWTRETTTTTWLVFLLLPVFLAQTQAQNGTATETEDFRQKGLAEHNNLRAKHGSPRLVLQDQLNKMATACARYYAKRDKQDHTCPYLQGAGENIAFSRTRPVEDKIREWYNEVQMYDFRYPGLYRQTSHFTQLVWRNSQNLGIGRATNPVNERVYYVSLYWPSGNVVGAFRDNVPIQSQ